MKKLLILLMVFLCCAPLVCAQEVLIVAPEGKAVWSIDTKIPVGTEATFTITQSNGVTTTGSISYQSASFVSNEATIELGGDSKTITYSVIPFSPSPLYVDIWNADNSTKSVRLLKAGYGLINGVYNDFATAEIQKYPITQFSIISDSEIEIDYELISASDAGAKLTAGDEQTWIDAIREYLPMLWGVFTGLIYWLKFLFVDHLVLTVVLYLTGTMAVAANTSRDIFKFYKTWFRQQAALFNFISSGFSVTISIITQVLSVIGGLITSLLSKLV